MLTLVGYELRRIVGRKGSFFSVMAVALAVALLVTALVAPEDQSEDVWIQVLGTPLVFGGAVVGALAGSYDVSQGTMRYLVLTGIPRWQLVVIRIPALIAAIALIATPAFLVGVYAMSSGDASAAEMARGLGGAVTYAALWGVVSLVVGTLLRSNGAGIAVALVLYLIGSAITLAVRLEISETIGDFLLPNVVSVFALFGHVPDQADNLSGMAWGTSAVAVVVWFVALTALAVARVERDEY